MREVKKVAFYVKYSRRNGQSAMFCYPKSSNPRVFFNLDDAKTFAKEAQEIMKSTEKKTSSPAAIERIWIIKTVKTVLE